MKERVKTVLRRTILAGVEAFAVWSVATESDPWGVGWALVGGLACAWLLYREYVDSRR